jgi:6-phosphogluconolactonase
MRMNWIRWSQRSQNQSERMAEVMEPSRRDHSGVRNGGSVPFKREQEAATLKNRRKGFFRTGFGLGCVAAAGLLTALLITACSQLTQTLTVDFVYVISSKAAGANNYGEIDVFEINSESGRMRQIPTSPFPSGGRNPVGVTVSADNQNLFVVNQYDNTLVQFAIGTDGKVYPFNTVNTPGIYPMAVTADKGYVFVVDTYEPIPLCSTAEPCSGSISVFPLGAGGSSSSALCAATVCLEPSVVNPAVNAAYWPLTLSGSEASHVMVPTAVNVLDSGAYIYVTAYDSSVTPSVGYVFGFAVGAGGVLTPVPNSPLEVSNPPSITSSQPSGVASDPTSSYLYVTDSLNSLVWGYSVGSTGALTALSSGPFATGSQPSAIVIDPSYPYAYVTNSQDGTLTAYSISNGNLSSFGTYATGVDPVAIGVDPSTNHFLYTVNFLSNTVSGFELSISDGTLLTSQFSPFATSTQPVAVAAIPHNGTGGGIQQ